MFNQIFFYFQKSFFRDISKSTCLDFSWKCRWKGSEENTDCGVVFLSVFRKPSYLKCQKSVFKTPYLKKCFYWFQRKGQGRETSIWSPTPHARDQTRDPGSCLWTGIQPETLQGAGCALTKHPHWSGQLEIFKIQDCCIKINSYSTPGVTELKNCKSRL